MAFISATPVLARAPSAFAPTASPARRPRVAVATRPVVSMKATPTKERKVAAPKKATNAPQLEKIPQGFTPFSEQLNGRFAMMGFMLGLVTEVITGKGMLAQVGSVFEIFNLASKLAN